MIQNENKHKIKHKKIYQLILELIKEEPLSVEELRLKLKNNKIEKTTKGIKEHYLDEMIDKKEIGSSNRLFKHNEDYKWIFKIAYEKEWSKTHVYYFYTPKSARLYSSLINFIDNQDNKSVELINSITNLFRCLELYAIFEKNRLSSSECIKREFTSRGTILNKDEVEAKKKKYYDKIVNFSLEDHTVETENRDLAKFLNILRNNMDDYIYFVGFYEKPNKERIGNPLIDLMKELFADIN